MASSWITSLSGVFLTGKSPALERILSIWYARLIIVAHIAFNELFSSLSSCAVKGFFCLWIKTSIGDIANIWANLKIDAPHLSTSILFSSPGEQFENVMFKLYPAGCGFRQIAFSLNKLLDMSRAVLGYRAFLTKGLSLTDPSAMLHELYMKGDAVFGWYLALNMVGELPASFAIGRDNKPYSSQNPKGVRVNRKDISVK